MNKAAKLKVYILLSILFILLAVMAYNIAYRYKAEIKCFIKPANCPFKQVQCIRNMQDKILGVLVKDINDNFMLVDSSDGVVSMSILTSKVWESHITEILNRIVKPGFTVLSIGGHIGYHVVQLGKLVGNNGSVYCFEANPKTMRFLRANIALNDLKNVTLFEKAVYSSDTTLRFAAYNDHDKNSGGSYVVPEGQKASSEAIEIEVEAVALDTVLEGVDKVDVIQMDIEGSEPNAIFGAKRLIERSPNLVIVQEWSIPMMSSHADVGQYIKFWRDLGYKFARITGSQLEELSDDALLSEKELIDVLITKDLESLKKTQ